MNGFSAAVAALAAAIACASASRAPDSRAQAELGKPFTLAPGESATLDGGKLSVKFVAVAEDSRCPKNEQCISAGNARVGLEVRVGGGEARPLTLETNRGASDAEVDGYSVLLEGVAPLPVSGRPIPPGEYRVTLSVGRGSAPRRDGDQPAR